MAWYWSDDLAKALVAEGMISQAAASVLTTAPVAFRFDETTIEGAGRALLDDHEIPLAA